VSLRRQDMNHQMKLKRRRKRKIKNKKYSNVFSNKNI
jgi:hypothetical protein